MTKPAGTAIQRALTKVLAALIGESPPFAVLNLRPAALDHEGQLENLCRLPELRMVLLLMDPQASWAGQLVRKTVPAQVLVQRGLIRLPAVLGHLLDGLQTPVANPFRFLPEVVHWANRSILGASSNPLTLSELFELCGRNTSLEARQKTRERVLHRHSEHDMALKVQIADLCSAVLRFNGVARDAEPFDVLWLENEPEARFLPSSAVAGAADGAQSYADVLLQAGRWFPRMNLFIRRSGFEELCCEVDRTPSDEVWIEANELVPRDESSDHLGPSRRINLNSVDLFLVDIYLDARVNGLDVQRMIKAAEPGSIVVMLSHSDDHENIRLAFEQGTEYYLLKRNFLSAFHLYYLAVDAVGPLVARIKDLDLRLHLQGLLRGWRHRRGFLWFGDKCFHMINHALTHTLHDWELVNEAAQMLIEQGLIGPPLSDEEIYALALGSWLHDIGHRGNERYGEAHQIRDCHGLLSAEFMVKNPELLGILEFDEAKGEFCGVDDYYDGQCFGAGSGQSDRGGASLPVRMLRRHQQNPWNGLSILERSALIALYHKSNAPLVPDDVADRKARSKVPDEYFESAGREPITLIDILQVAYPRDSPKIPRFLSLIALFRLVDGLDIHGSRVGGLSEGQLKKTVIRQDLEYNLRKLEIEAQAILDNPEYRGRLDRELPATLIEHVCSRKPIPPELKNAFSEALPQEKPFLSLLNYAEFISVQDGHFDLHGCVENVSITLNDATGRVRLEYRLNRPYAWLQERTVREKAGEYVTLWQKLFGSGRQGEVGVVDVDSLPYPLGELRSASRFLREWMNLDRGIEHAIRLPRRGLAESGTSELRDLGFEVTPGEQPVVERVFFI